MTGSVCLILFTCSGRIDALYPYCVEAGGATHLDALMVIGDKMVVVVGMMMMVVLVTTTASTSTMTKAATVADRRSGC